MVQKIAIYRGEGTWYQGLIEGTSLSALDLIEGDWDQKASLFIMPGGRDRLYHAALQGRGNQKIRAFVESGGTYLGICAGAYYGCKSFEFEKGYPLEICEERELSFFSGLAIGPAYGPGTYVYGSRQGSRAAPLITEEGTFHSYHYGGCFFAGDFSTCRILARYADLPNQPPAIIECSIGKGKAILSGVHLEITAESLDPTEPHFAACIPLLRTSESQRLSFWEKFIGKYAKFA